MDSQHDVAVVVKVTKGQLSGLKAFLNIRGIKYYFIQAPNKQEDTDGLDPGDRTGAFRND